MIRVIRALLVALALTGGLGSAAAAGGWAVTTLDRLPDRFVAGSTHEIGWTIRQHGVTPINVADFVCRPACTTEIVLVSGSDTRAFPGVQTGAVGHYVARVIVPQPGEWTWLVTQGPFQAQRLGSLPIDRAQAPVAAGDPPAAQAVASTPRFERIDLVLPFASGAAAALFVATLVLYLRRPRRYGVA